jgi:hypothetical protein
VLYNAGLTVNVPVQWIPEVCKCWATRVHTFFVVRLMASHCNPRTVRLFLVFHFTDLLFGFGPQSLGHSFVPCYHVFVWICRETLPRQDLGQDLTSIRVLDIPAPHCFNEELRMFIGAKKQLDSLPHDPALILERRYGGIGKGDRVRQRL